MLLQSRHLRRPLQILTLAAAILASVVVSPAGAEEPTIIAATSSPETSPAQNTDQQGHAAEHAQAPATQNPLPAPATTSHTLALPGRTLRFKAIASAIRLSDAETLAPKADIATVAFILDGADPAKR
ncbi:MAG TPA: peptidase S10, partial [Methylocella sp.]|nr:peptidase S10 [Methylocella sp.]